MIKAELNNIQDAAVVDAMRSVLEQLNRFPMLQGNWKFFTYTTTAAVTNLQVNHTLKFAPKDVILLSVTNGATVTWAYSSFTRTTITFTTSGATTIRAFIGTFKEE